MSLPQQIPILDAIFEHVGSSDLVFVTLVSKNFHHASLRWLNEVQSEMIRRKEQITSLSHFNRLYLSAHSSARVRPSINRCAKWAGKQGYMDVSERIVAKFNPSLERLVLSAAEYNPSFVPELIGLGRRRGIAEQNLISANAIGSLLGNRFSSELERYIGDLNMNVRTSIMSFVINRCKFDLLPFLIHIWDDFPFVRRGLVGSGYERLAEKFNVRGPHYNRLGAALEGGWKSTVGILLEIEGYGVPPEEVETIKIEEHLRCVEMALKIEMLFSFLLEQGNIRLLSRIFRFIFTRFDPQLIKLYIIGLFKTISMVSSHGILKMPFIREMFNDPLRYDVLGCRGEITGHTDIIAELADWDMFRTYVRVNGTISSHIAQTLRNTYPLTFIRIMSKIASIE